MKDLKNKILILFLILFINCYQSPAFLIENTVLSKSYKVTFSTPILFKNEYSHLENKFVNTMYYNNKEKDISLRINIMVDDIRIDRSSLYIHYLISQSTKKLKFYFNNSSNKKLLTYGKYIDNKMEISSIGYLMDNQIFKIDCQIEYENIIFHFVIVRNKQTGNLNSIQKIKEKILETIKITNLKNLYNKRL